MYILIPKDIQIPLSLFVEVLESVSVDVIYSYAWQL